MIFKSKKESYLKKMCILTGETQNPNESDDELRMIEIPIVSQNQCQRRYDSRVTSRMICAGLMRGGKDSCFGDSGGPLACTINGSTVLVGVVSFGPDEECGKPNAPGIYSKISTVRDWISEKANV